MEDSDISKRKGELKRQFDKERMEFLRQEQQKLERLANLVDRFNSLMDEERYEEAAKVASRGQSIAPDNPAVRAMVSNSRS